jgi:hypothetical protein
MKLILFILLLPCFLNAQTVVIAKKTKNSIIVGADSRETFYFVDPKTKEKIKKFGSICKIYSSGKFNFAVIGGSIEDNINCAKKACLKANNFEDLIISYANDLTNVLNTNLEILRTYLPDTYNQLVESQRPVFCQVFFFGYQADTALLKLVAMKVQNKISEPVKVEAFGLQADLLFGGHVEEIRDPISKPKTWKKGISETIKNLIILEEEFHGDEVGGEIQITEVKRKSTRWINKKPPCN